MASLISKLFDVYAGQPILVVGGGPSVSQDLPMLAADGFEPVCVIGANDHSPKQHVYKTDFLVNVDRWHVEKKIPMQEVFKPYGLPVINRHSWGDYRLANWSFHGNSGLTAVAVAVALGGNPVVVTGIDMWAEGRYYFHIPIPQQRRMRGTGDMATKVFVRNRAIKQMDPLTKFARGANIRPVQGPLTNAFKQYEFGQENFAPSRACEYRKAHRGEAVYQMRATKPYKFGERDKLKVGDEMPMSFDEKRITTVQSHFTLARVE